MNSCRKYELGPIPYTEVVFLADKLGFDPDMAEYLYLVVEQLDVAYQSWVADKIKKDSGGA